MSPLVQMFPRGKEKSYPKTQSIYFKNRPILMKIQDGRQCLYKSPDNVFFKYHRLLGMLPVENGFFFIIQNAKLVLERTSLTTKYPEKNVFYQFHDKL